MRKQKKYIKIDTEWFDGRSSFNRLSDTDYGDELYGKELYAITLQDIMHLMQGGRLYSTINGEYAMELYFAGDEKDNIELATPKDDSVDEVDYEW